MADPPRHVPPDRERPASAGGFPRGGAGGSGPRAPGGGRRASAHRLAGILLCLLPLAAACGDPTSEGSGSWFGQSGELVVEVETTLPPDELGSVTQRLTWESSGAWSLEETIAYRGLVGDGTTRRSRGHPGAFAGDYVTLIRQLNETRGLELFVADLPQGLDPECERGRSRFTLVLRDHARGEEARWIRCADGSLFTATPGGAGPDPAASRIVTAAQLAKSFTLGEAERSAYEGSVPFGSLDRGEDSPARPDSGRIFVRIDPVEETPEAPAGWNEFWEAHAGADAPEPEVDWSREMVLMAASGERTEAGDSIEVRRILRVDEGTRVEVYERVPGDFCSPAARSQYPFHIVVAPRTSEPVRFADLRVERVPCGGFEG